MIKALVFDMDGTIADFYGVENWLSDIRSENPAPYLNAEPLFDMITLVSLLERARELGIKVIIDTWLAKDSSEEFKTETRKAKRDWLNKYNFPYDNFHGIQYGRTKADAIRNYISEEAILFDDNEQVRKGWTLGRTVDPTKEDIISVIENLLKGK